MTEQEAINGLEMDIETFIGDRCCSDAEEEEVRQELEIVKNALEELQQYRALGSVEELKEAREKQIAKKPICVPKPYSEEVGINEEWNCPSCGAYVGYFTEAMSEPEQMEYCTKCGQHIARDWSEI